MGTTWKPKGDSYTDSQGRQWRWHPGQKKYVRNYGTSPAAYIHRKVTGAAKGVFDTYKRFGTSAKDKYDTAVKNRKKVIIGKGTEDNPEFRTDSRGRLKKNPNYKPPTTVAKNNNKNNNKNNQNNNKDNPWSVGNVRRKIGGEIGRSNAGPGITWHKDNGKKDGDQGTQETPKTNTKVETKKKPLPTTVFTKHYKTGKELGVMTKNERRAYEKEAGQRTWESEKKRLGATGNKQNTKASSKSWRKKAEQKLAERKRRKEENVFTA